MPLAPPRRVLALVVAVLASGAGAQEAPVRLLVGFPPGGTIDTVARHLAPRLKSPGGPDAIVDSRPGAGGQIAALALKAAAPDGLTLFVTNDHTINTVPLVLKNPGFDPAVDFVPVAGLATFVNALALSAAAPPKSMAEYVAHVRAQGGKAGIGVPAPASVPEFLVRLLGRKYQLDLVAVPYRGAAPVIADLLGNQVGAGVAGVSDFLEHHRAGKLRIVAVMGTARHASLPDAPTFAELGVEGLESSSYVALYAPAGTPAAVIERISMAIARSLAAHEVRERLSALGLTVGYIAPAELAARQKAASQAWAGVIRATGFQPQ